MSNSRFFAQPPVDTLPALLADIRAYISQPHEINASLSDLLDNMTPETLRSAMTNCAANIKIQCYKSRSRLDPQGEELFNRVSALGDTQEIEKIYQNYLMQNSLITGILARSVFP